MWDARNYYLSGATFHFKYTQHISAAISNMQGLTNFIRVSILPHEFPWPREFNNLSHKFQRAPKDVIRHGPEFEAALASQLIMLAPLAPHFASECWYRLASAADKADLSPRGIDWSLDVLEQQWPEVDMDYNLDFTVYVNGEESKVLKVCRRNLDVMTDEQAVAMALSDVDVGKAINSNEIRHTKFRPYPGCQADLYISVKRPQKKGKEK